MCTERKRGLGLEIYIPLTFQLLKAAFLEGSDPHAMPPVASL